MTLLEFFWPQPLVSAHTQLLWLGESEDRGGWGKAFSKCLHNEELPSQAQEQLFSEIKYCAFLDEIIAKGSMCCGWSLKAKHSSKSEERFLFPSWGWDLDCATHRMLCLSPITTGWNASFLIFQSCEIKLDGRTVAKGSVNWKKSNKFVSDSSSNHSIRWKVAQFSSKCQQLCSVYSLGPLVITSAFLHVARRVL